MHRCGGVPAPCDGGMPHGIDQAMTTLPSVTCQPDLFDAADEDVSDRVPSVPDGTVPGPPDGCTDDDLISAIPKAGVSNVDALCAEVVARSLAAAVPALEALWKSFTGFGPNRPHRQQLAVIATLAQLESATSHRALRRIVLSRSMPDSLLPVALQAACEALLALPPGFVEPLLAHDETTVRRAAFSLALRSGVAIDGLREGLHDPDDSIRRLAAVALGLRGDDQAREPLIGELSLRPSTEIIEAIAAVWDDDVIVHLGRCGNRHPDLAGDVLGALHDIDTKKALTVAATLQSDAGRSR